jgi:hypothetical protein
VPHIRMEEIQLVRDLVKDRDVSLCFDSTPHDGTCPLQFFGSFCGWRSPGPLCRLSGCQCACILSTLATFLPLFVPSPLAFLSRCLCFLFSRRFTSNSYTTRARDVRCWRSCLW